MNKTKRKNYLHKFLFLLPILLFGCMHEEQAEKVVSMQVIDRNGFSETISNTDRLNTYENVNFFSSQPYQKVLRIYGKNYEGKSRSKLTSYHENGGIWQYLEALDGRANGFYKEWHENGELKIDGFVIEGLADLSPSAMRSWLFDQTCTIYDNQGNIEAIFSYQKGHLEGEAKYFYPNGATQKIIPYSHGEAHGVLTIFDEHGNTLESISYYRGERHGQATGSWAFGVTKYVEEYAQGNLIEACYYDPQNTILGEIHKGEGVCVHFVGKKVATLTEYAHGVPYGLVKNFLPDGSLQSVYTIKEGKKTGEEWEYYPGTDQAKLLLTWHKDQIQGMCKTWYKNGQLESDREMSGNKKHGLSFAYYKNGELMLMEEYENDRLKKGSYYKQGNKHPVSTIESGKGVATLFSSEGHFLQKIPYEVGYPTTN